jgi:hypothetical protein
MPRFKTGSADAYLAAILGYAVDDLDSELKRRPPPVHNGDQAGKTEAAIYYTDVVDLVVKMNGEDLTPPEKQQLTDALLAEIPNRISRNQQ